jgi:hypothetical protein
MKLILWIVLTSGFATTAIAEDFDAQLWNHLTCFYRTQGNVTNLRYEQHTKESFYFITGDIKLLSMAWTTKRPEFNVGYCSKMINVGSNDSAIMESVRYKATFINKIADDCTATGQNVEVIGSEKKIVKRGEFIKFEVPWEKPFDSARVIEYIPTAEEAQRMDIISWQRCLDLQNN